MRSVIYWIRPKITVFNKWVLLNIRPFRQLLRQVKICRVTFTNNSMPISQLVIHDPYVISSYAIRVSFESCQTDVNLSRNRTWWTSRFRKESGLMLNYRHETSFCCVRFLQRLKIRSPRRQQKSDKKIY